MRQEPRIVLLTGSERRHRYAATAVAERTAVVGIVTEEGGLLALGTSSSPEDRETIRQHLAERDAVEARMLGRSSAWPPTARLQLPLGGVNQPEGIAWVRKRRPEVVVLFGASVIQEPLLQLFGGRIVNVHLGLSPYYRGSGTNFWPLVERKPECVGATIHLAVAQVDGGPILGQIRPKTDAHDRAHDVGTKAIVAAFRVLPIVLRRYLDGGLPPVRQDLTDGRVFRSGAFNAAAVRQLWANFEAGMMQEYVRDAEVRCRAYPIVPVANEREIRGRDE